MTVLAFAWYFQYTRHILLFTDRSASTMAARNEFDTDLDDAEQGASGSNIQINQAEFKTPIGSALRQPRFRLTSSVNPTTARLRCVSSSLLQAAPGSTNQFGDGNAGQQQHQR